MKILHISGARTWGGNEQQLEYLVKGLNKKEARQFIFCYKKTPLVKKFDDLDVCLYKINYVKPYKKHYWKELKNAVNKIKPDIIHLHTSDSVTGYVVTDLIYKLGTKAVFSKKGISRKTSLLSKLKYNYNKIHKVICVSRIVEESFKEILNFKNHEKLIVIHDGVKVQHDVSAIDLRKDLNIPKETKIIGNIANHTRAKDLFTFIKTADYLINQKKIQNIHFVQIGEFTDLTETLQENVKKFALQNEITFCGFTAQASSLLPQFDVFLMTSEREGGPSSVLEAMYQRVPVVSTKVGVVPEAIQNKKSGFIAEVGDFHMLAGFIQKLINQPGLANEFSEKSYQMITNNYTAEVLVEKTYSVYIEILNC